MKNTNNISLGYDDDDIFNLVKFTYTFTNPESPTSEQHIEITIDLLEALHEYFNKREEPTPVQPFGVTVHWLIDESALFILNPKPSIL